MRVLQLRRLWLCLWIVAVLPAAAQEAGGSRSPSLASDLAATAGAPAAPHSLPSSFDDVVDRVVDREHQLLAQMRNLRPMVETYLQNLKTLPGAREDAVRDYSLLPLPDAAANR